jgi:tetratricopeptide (TPR) repeat protein
MGLDLSRRALAAGDGDAEVLAWVAAARMQAAEDITGVDSLMARSLALNPGLAIARWGTGWCKLYLGQTDLAQEHLVDALRMDPRSGMRPITVAGLGYCSLFAHRYEEAARLLIDAAESRPSIQRWTLTAAAAAYAHLGEPARARQLLARMPSPIPASYNRSIMGLFRRPEDRELIRSGLVLAGADV